MMNKEEQILKKRIAELSGFCYSRNIPVYTNFLTLNEQTIFHEMSGLYSDLKVLVTGGYEAAERKIVCFLPSYAENEFEIPICSLKIAPVQKKFAEQLNHRDFLGAVMNLGIERSKIGDILIDGTGGHLICMKDMGDYICRQLQFIKHTKVSCEISAVTGLDAQINIQAITGSIASERLDAVISLAFQLSRSKACAYIEHEKVFINGRLCLSAHGMLKEEDLVSVRGLGKFKYCGVKCETKKGRLLTVVEKYC